MRCIGTNSDLYTVFWGESWSNTIPSFQSSYDEETVEMGKMVKMLVLDATSST